MPYKDPEKRKANRKKWYRKNKSSEIKYVKERKSKIKKWFIALKKSLKCEICDEDHPATLDFHHKDKKRKDNEVAFMAYYGYSKARILKEIEKCQVLCSNCHRKIHYDKF